MGNQWGMLGGETPSGQPCVGWSSCECAGDGRPSPLLLVKLQLQMERREDPRGSEGLRQATGQSPGLGQGVAKPLGLRSSNRTQEAASENAQGHGGQPRPHLGGYPFPSTDTVASGTPHGHALHRLASSVCGQGSGWWGSGPPGSGAPSHWVRLKPVSAAGSSRGPGCSVQMGPGGRNLPSGEGVNHRSAAGESEEHLLRASWGWWTGSRAWGSRQEAGGLEEALPPPPPPHLQVANQSLSRRPPARQRPGDRSEAPGPLPGAAPALLSRQGGLSGLSLLPSPIPTPTSSRLLLAAGSPSPGSTTGPLTAERPAWGAPMGCGQLRAPPAVLPQMSGLGWKAGRCTCSRSRPLSPHLLALLTGRGQGGQSVDSSRSNTAFTACWEPAVSSWLALSSLQMAEPRSHGFRGG